MYKQKYLKYKAKYTNLIYEISGGSKINMYGGAYICNYEHNEKEVCPNCVSLKGNNHVDTDNFDNAIKKVTESFKEVADEMKKTKVIEKAKEATKDVVKEFTKVAIKSIKNAVENAEAVLEENN